MQSSKYKNKDEIDEIDLTDLLKILSDKKWFVFSFTSTFTILIVAYSLFLPNLYESHALLASSNTNNISKSLKSYQGLAGLAGIDIPSTADDTNSFKAIEKMNSLSFFENQILPNIFLANLMAVESWNPETNSIKYDDSIYIESKDKWVRDFTFPQKLIPSAQESFKVFIDNHIVISEDKETGFISLKVQHQSPVIAEKWTRIIVDQINNFYRELDKQESEKAIKFLSNQINMNNLDGVTDLLASLLQEQIQKLTLIEANEFYVFEFIDPPAVMEEKSSPNRLMIAIIAALFGLISSIFITFLHRYFYKDLNITNQI